MNSFPLPTTIGGRVQLLVRTRGLKIKHLAEAVGLSGQGLRDILSGKSKSPKVDVVASIARELNVSIDYLLYGTDSQPGGHTLSEPSVAYARVEAQRTTATKGIPFIAIGLQGAFAEAVQAGNTPDSAPSFYLPPSMSLKGELLSFEMEGESMAPDIKPNSVLVGSVVKGELRYLQSGYVYALVYAGHFGIRRVVRQPGKEDVVELQALNPAYGKELLKMEDIHSIWRIHQIISWL